MDSLISEVKKSVLNIFNTFIRKIQNIFVKIRKGPAMAVRKFSKKITKLVFKKESSLKDYVSVGNFLISKRIFIFILAVIILGVTGFYTLADGKFIFDKRIYLADKTAFSGNVKIYDNKQDKNLIYKGALLNGLYDDTDGKLYFLEDPSILRYIGEFKMGKFSGHGILYSLDSCKLYEGAFENDLYEGKGTLYHQNGNKKYQGSFKNGLYCGEGTEFYSDGIVLFQGIFENNVPEGSCKEFYPSGAVKYDGNFSKGLYSGNGTLFDENENLVYLGEFTNGEFNGYGDLYKDEKIIFSGKFFKGETFGDIKEFDENGNIVYSGNMENGKYSKKGILYQKIDSDDFEDENFGIKYDGNFNNGNFDGEGTLYFDESTSLEYTGDFKDGKYDGEGTLYNDDELNSEAYSGNFKNGLYHGFGKLFDKDGKILYEGEFAKGLFDGDGISYINGKAEYIGQYKDNLYHGEGKLLNENGAILYEGELKNGLYDGFGTLYGDMGGLQFKGFFVSGKDHIEGYLNISEATLKKYLDQPDNTVVLDDGSLDLYYTSLGYIFNLKLDDLNNSTTFMTDSMKITSSTEIDGINTSMTASIVEGILGKPDVQMDINPSENIGNDTESGDDMLYEAVYYRQNYALYMLFSNYKTTMDYMQIKRYEN